MNAVWLAFLAPLAVHATLQETYEACQTRAREQETRGELAQARESWLAASRLVEPGIGRETCVDAARALGMRLDLRSELIAARPLDERVFSELGIEAADERGLTLRGERVLWSAAPFDVLMRACTAARVSPSARAGLVLERLARGDAKERDAALADLGKLVEKKELEAHDASAAVARVRGEQLPARGYVFRNGKWLDADLLDREVHASGLEGLGLALETAAPADREARIAALDALGPEGLARANAALETRWNNAFAELAKGTTLSGLQQLAETHTELSARRKHALELIYDEVKYFYPYNPPECPPEKAKLYAGVQQEVDARVAAVREVWKTSRSVRLPERFRAAVEELQWSATPQRQRKLAFTWPAEVPEWVRFVDARSETVDLATFAGDAAERARLDQDALVGAFNTRSFALRESEALAAPNNEERSQVAITNEYRRMLGRPLLAWCRKLQLSAQKHSDYMSRSGNFSHFEEDPARKSVTERTRAEGYKGGAGENIHQGDSGPEGAHVGWTHSSGHHRQLLSDKVHEMAAAISGDDWTQNFGGGTEWRDPAVAPKR